MTTATSLSIADKSISAAWPAFSHKLASALVHLEEDHFLIVSVKQSNRYVQFAGQGSLGMRVEATSNRYLSKAEQLDAGEILALLEVGWHEPTYMDCESTPETDPDGSPNFYADFATPVSFETVADMAVRTLIWVLRVPHPGYLEYEAFDAEQNSFSMNELGLKAASRETDNLKDLSTRLQATVESVTGLSNLEFDDDGDLPVRYGSAIVFARLIRDPVRIRLHSPILRGIDASPDVLARINDLNGGNNIVRFLIQDDIVVGVTDIPAAPFVARQVESLFSDFCALIDGLDDVLQAEWGGETAFEGRALSVLRH